MSKIFGSLSHIRKINKIKIDEIPDNSSKDDSDSFTDEVYRIVMKDLLKQPQNPESETNEKIRFNQCPKDHPTTFLFNSANIRKNNPLSNSNLSIRSDKTAATSLDIHSKNNLIDKTKLILSIDNENSFVNKKINIIKIISGLNKNTMLEIKNIPKTYTLADFKEEINTKGFKFKYNYLTFKINDRYTENNGTENDDENYHTAFINFLDPLHILIFYELYNNKYFGIKGKKTICINYSEHKPERIINLVNENKNNNDVKDNNSLIEVPLKYLDLYKTFNPKDHCVFNLNNAFNIETFIVKKF